MSGKGHRGRIGQALFMVLFAVSVLFAASAAAAASPAHPAGHAMHGVTYGLADAWHPEGGAVHETGCTSHAQCSAAVAMPGPGSRSIHKRAIAAPAPLVLLLPGGLSAVPHAKPPIV